VNGQVKIQINDDEPVIGGLTIDQDWIDVTSITATTPDLSWQYTDPRGHYHAYTEDGKLPTLQVRTVHHLCDGDDDDEDCEGYDTSYYVCAICGDAEVVEPHRLPEGPKQIPGRQSWTVEVPVKIERGDQVSVRIWTPDALLFGVGQSHGVVRAEGGPEGVRVTSKILQAGPLGRRRLPREGGQSPSA